MSNPESKFVVTAEDRATATLKKVAAEFGGLGRAAMSAAGMLAGFGGALSVGVIASQVKAIADLQDGFGKLAQQTGIGVQSLTELDYAARLSDVSTEDLATGVTRLTSKMADVTQGSKEAAAVFDSLGVKVKNSDGTLRSSPGIGATSALRGAASVSSSAARGAAWPRWPRKRVRSASCSTKRQRRLPSSSTTT